MRTRLYPHQTDAISQMHNGCILCGGVGSGKSRAAVAYYCKENNGDFKQIGDSEEYEIILMDRSPMDLYIITTAKKRDSGEWKSELVEFAISATEDGDTYFNHKVVIDSWNNITKYKDVSNAFFIFDEQRVVGWGTWSKTFVNIAKNNRWILLSATPGDKWHDYVPVFVANGFFTGKTDFERKHVKWSRFCTKYPKIESYLGLPILQNYRDQILVDMPCERKTVRHYVDIHVEYDIDSYRKVSAKRWNPFTDRPIKDAAELCRTLRRIVDEDESRQVALLELFEHHPKLIIFYNFDYELDILRELDYGEGAEVAEWNGHKHQPIPTGKKWVYLVQYSAGAEGWNCITTDTIVFFSQSYSYKMSEQASGRIDRLNTPYRDLYYYRLMSNSGIDLAIRRSLNAKKKFNEQKFGDKFLSAMDRRIRSRINWLRRSILIESIAYYRYDEELLTDEEWDEQVAELLKLQDCYPNIAKDAVLGDCYSNFDGTTGRMLPLNHNDYLTVTEQRIKMHRQGGAI